MTERAAFATELRRARERQGLSLDAIAEQTKVSATLFAGLERGDLSRWPPGIFRRAFVRSYALAVGLDPEETVARFCRLFHDPTDESKTAAASSKTSPEAVPPSDTAAPEAAEVDDAPGSRLALEQARSVRSARYVAASRRLLSGLLDILLAVTPASLAALAVGLHWFWPVLAGVAATGHLSCYATIGTTPGAWLMRRLTAPQPPLAASRGGRRRADADGASAPRRHVPRHQSARPAPHAHRVRH